MGKNSRNRRRIPQSPRPLVAPGSDEDIALRHNLMALERDLTRKRERADELGERLRRLEVEQVFLEAAQDESHTRLRSLFADGPTEGIGPDGTTWTMPVGDMIPVAEASHQMVEAIESGRCRFMLNDTIELAFYAVPSDNDGVHGLMACGRVADEPNTGWLLGTNSGKGASQRDPEAMASLIAAIEAGAVRNQTWRDRLRSVIERDRMIAAVTPPPRSVHDQLRPSGLPHLRGVFANDLTGDDGTLNLDRPDWASVAALLAQPVWIGPELGEAIADSDPPDDDVLASLRLPHRTQLVIASMPLAAPEGTWTVQVPWGGYDENPTWWSTAASEVHMAGVVLLSDGDGQLRDDAVVLLGIDLGDYFRTPEFSERMHRWAERHNLQAGEYDAWMNGNGVSLLHQVYVTDWRDTMFADRIGRLAAAVAVCNEHGYDAATDPFPPGPARKVIRTSSFRKGANRGRYTRIRVIDLVRNRQRDTDGTPTGRTVSPHFRRGHWRRVRCGHRDDWWYEPRWIAPTYVAGDKGGDAAMQVWRTVADDQRDGQVGGAATTSA